jgi:ABC-type multidrug transport system fused ATPase/permease subunit
MRQLTKSFALIIFVLSITAYAQSSTKIATIGELAAAISEAFTAGNLDSLDAGKPYAGKIKIVIEHSLAGDDDKDRFATKTFKTLAAAEDWLDSRESSPGMPSRHPSQVLTCRKGVCDFFDQGLLHNNLYLKRLDYGYRNGIPFIKAIHFLDGD